MPLKKWSGFLEKRVQFDTKRTSKILKEWVMDEIF